MSDYWSFFQLSSSTQTQLIIWCINVLFQATAIACAGLTLGWLFRRSPALRSSLQSACVLLLLLCPPIVASMQYAGWGVAVSWERPSSAVNLPRDSANDESSSRGKLDGNPVQLSSPEPIPASTNLAPAMDAFRQSNELVALDASQPELEERAPGLEQVNSVNSNVLPSSPADSASIISTPYTENASNPMFASRDIAMVFIAMWLFGALFASCRLLMNWLSVVKLISESAPVENVDILGNLKRACDTLGIAPQRIELRHTPIIDGPLAAGIVNPKVLLPTGFTDSIHDEQLHNILVHELAHIERRDQVVVLLQHVVGSFFWLHPLVGVLNRSLAKAREEICDNYVLGTTNARSYSRTLLAVAELVRGRETLPGTVGLFSSKWRLEHRVAGLLDARRNLRTTLTRRGLWLVASVLLLVAATASLSTLTLADPIDPNATVPTTIDSDDAARPDDLTPQDDKHTGKAAAKTADDVSESDEASKANGTVKASASITGSRKTNDQQFLLKGSVLLPDETPAASAELWVGGPAGVDRWRRQRKEIEWIRLGETDSAGNFNTSFDAEKIWFAKHWTGDKKLRFAATKDGYGFIWKDLSADDLRDANSGNFTLELVEDLPIEGRILTLDGPPAANVTIAVAHLTPTIVDLDPQSILENASMSSGVYTNWMSVGGSPVMTKTKTDASGRFRMEGLGRNRWVNLEAHSESNDNASSIGDMRLAVVNVPAPENVKNGLVRVREGLAYSTYFSKFTHAAVAAQRLQGRVVDAETGQPVAGAKLVDNTSWRSRALPSVSSQDGTFDLRGVPSAEEYWLDVEPTSGQHFRRTFHVSDENASSQLEIEVYRGVVVRGRATDQVTGEARHGLVEYNAVFPNDNISRFSDERVARPLSRSVIREDGTYEIAVLPGPGAIGFLVEDDSLLSARVTADQLQEFIGDVEVSSDADEFGDLKILQTAVGGLARSLMSIRNFKHIELLRPAEDASVLKRDVELVRSLSRKGRIVDEQGQPVAGVLALGLASGIRGPLPTSGFAVHGLARGRKRKLLFLHKDKHLGAVLTIDGDSQDEVVVTLKPTGTIRGRLTTRIGEPMPVAYISITNEELRVSTSEFWHPKLEKDGSFEVTNLIADSKHSFRVQIPEERMSRYVPDGEVVVKSGEIKDLGTFRPAEGKYGLENVGTETDPETKGTE